jgi:hypothetical protein
MGSMPPEGPGGTFIGVGSEGKIVAASNGSVTAPRGIISTVPTGGAFRPPMKPPPPLPARARMGSISPETPTSFPPQGARSAPNPAAVVRRLPPPAATPSDMRSSRPDSHAESSREGSIPAYGNTLNFGAVENTRDTDPRMVGRRKSSFAVWMMAVVLASAVFGSIAFFAAKRTPLPADGANGSDPGIPATPVTSATLTPPPATSMIITAPAEEDAHPGASTAALTGKDASAVVVPKPAATSPRTSANGGGVGHAPRNPIRPTPPVPTPAPEASTTTLTPTATDATATQDPPKASATAVPSGLAPDPFGTPE